MKRKKGKKQAKWLYFSLKIWALSNSAFMSSQHFHYQKEFTEAVFNKEMKSFVKALVMILEKAFLKAFSSQDRRILILP